VINDFLTYVQWQIVTGKYDANVVLNVDETNIEMSGKTLAKIGTLVGKWKNQWALR
jgi:hypothetical protein